MAARRRRIPFWWVLVTVLLVVAAGYVGYRYLGSGQPPVAGAPLPSIGGPFNLVDQNAHQVSDDVFRGRYMLVYFGYTYCPDVCPTMLTTMSRAIELLGDDGDKIDPVFITIDPERDSIEQLKMYAGYFHPRLIALTGKASEIAEVAAEFRVYYAKVKRQGAESDDYQIDHTSIVYLIGPDGHYRTHFTEGTTAEIMAQRIREVL